MRAGSIRIALRGIAANGLRSGLTTLGIMIGVASVILLVAVGSGSAAANRARLESLGSNTLTVFAGGFGPRGGGSGVEITDDDVNALLDPNAAPDIAEVLPSVNVQGGTVVVDGVSTTPGSVTGTTPNYTTVRNHDVQAGRFITQNDLDAHSNVVVLGISVAKNIYGEDVDPTILLDQTISLGGKKFAVIGILEEKGSNGFQDQDDLAIIPITTAWDRFNGDTGTIGSLTVQAVSAEATTAAQNEVTSILESRHRDEDASFTVLNQASLLETQEESNRTFTVLLGAVAAISLLVGGIGVMNIMLVTVTERTREIGIRKAVGARHAHILVQFLIEAVLLTCIGGFLGAATGIIGSHWEIIGIKPVVEPYSVIASLGVAFSIGLFFGIYPANRAASLSPIDALRHE